MDRERRVTAGKRMTALVGKALEDDDAFWGHDTWNDDDDDGNASFRSSDEDSDMKRDEFDSDFDDSENEDDENAQDDERGRMEEEQLKLEERRTAQRGKAALSSSSSYKDVASKASRAMAMRKQKGKQLVTGRGLNAGIVLNLPPPLPPTAAPGGASSAPVALQSLTAAVASADASLPRTAAPASPFSAKSAQQQSTTTTTLSIARTKPRRAITKPKRKAAASAAIQMASASSSASSSALPTQSTGTFATASTSTSSPASHKAKKRKTEPTTTTSTTTFGGDASISQEQMILEAVHETEPENERWRLARERRMRDSDLQQQQQQSANRDGGSSHHHKNVTIVEKFVSRRGYLNVICFPEMDHVPPILQQRHQHTDGMRHRRGHAVPSANRPKPVCVITGKPAKYRDPKTGHPYHDVEAFREIRRRHEAGEPIVPSSAAAPLLSNGTDDIPKAVATDPDGMESNADDSAKPSAGNGAAKTCSSAVLEAKDAPKASSSSSSSPLRIRIQASSILASQHPTNAITAPTTEITTVPPVASSSLPSAASNLPLPCAPAEALPVTSHATNPTSEQLTISTAPAQSVDSSAVSLAAAAPVTSPATEVVAAAPLASAPTTVSIAETIPATTKSAPSNGASGSVAVAPLPISASSVPPTPRQDATGSSEDPSTPPRGAPSIAPSTPVPLALTNSYSPHTHPELAPSLPSPGPGSGLGVRASPRQRKPTAKVLQGLP